MELVEYASDRSSVSIQDCTNSDGGDPKHSLVHHVTLRLRTLGLAALVIFRRRNKRSTSGGMLSPVVFLKPLIRKEG